MNSRYLRVMLLQSDGKVIWKNIGWGKKYLDEVRKDGTHILMSFIEYG